jgi:hypothetical protein
VRRVAVLLPHVLASLASLSWQWVFEEARPLPLNLVFRRSVNFAAIGEKLEDSARTDFASGRPLRFETACDVPGCEPATPNEWNLN